MKQKILYIILMITAFLGRGEMVFAWGENTSYVVDLDQNTYNVNDEAKTYDLSGPGLTLTYQSRDESGWSTGGIKVTAYDANNNPTVLSDYNTNNGWEDKTIDLSKFSNYLYFKKIEFKETGTLAKKIRNVQITRATTFDATPAAINWGTVLLNEVHTKKQNITAIYNNTKYNQQLTAQCVDANNSVSNIFTLDKSEMTIGATGSIDIEVSLNASVAHSYSANIILKRGGAQVASIPINVNVVEKYSPTFTFKTSSVYTGHVYALSDIFSSDSPANYNISIGDADSDKAKIIDGKLYVLGQSGSFDIIVSQAETEQWYEKSEKCNVSIVEGAISAYTEQLNDFSIYSSFPTSTYNKIVNIPFPCKKVSYKAKLQAAGYSYLTLKTSQDHGANWVKLTDHNWNNDTGEKSFVETIDIRTTHIDFFREKGSTLELWFYDFYFHMASYMTPSESSVRFDRTMKGQTSTAKTITIDWSDVEDYANNLKVFSDNSNFEVSVNQHSPCTPYNKTWGTSNERWGQSTISITFKPNDTGNFSGNIYFYDNKRFITIPVSGEAYGPLVLNPGVNPSTQIIKEENYSQVVLERTFSAGYSTATFPFDYNISEVANAFAAQLKLVTYNSNDGYTLYFEKKGYMYANQPYVVYLPVEIKGPLNFGAKDIKVPDAQSIIVNGWTMQANYTPEFPMHGNYGIAGGLLCRGEGENAKINAYTAYFIPPTTQNVRTRVAVLDEWGNATYIGEIKDGVLQAEEGIFGLDGVQQNALRKGINIVKTKDGTVRKVLK